MKALLVMQLLATSIQAQSLADAARQERERQAKVKSTVIIKEEGPAPAALSPAPTPTSDGKPNEPNGQPEARKAGVLPEPDLTTLWDAKADDLRKKIRDLQDQETALQLQQINQQNQIYAPVVDPALKDRAQADLTQTIQQLAKVREDLDMTRKELDTMLAEGPPKKSSPEPGRPQPQPKSQPQPDTQPQPKPQPQP